MTSRLFRVAFRLSSTGKSLERSASAAPQARSRMKSLPLPALMLWPRLRPKSSNFPLAKSRKEPIMKIIKTMLVLALALLPPALVRAQLLEKKVLTLEAADKIAAAAETEAKKRNATVVIVVVDDGGYPLVLKRLNDTQVASVDVGIGKARTAAIFRRPSKDFEDQIKNGRVASLVLPGATPLQGGLPLVFEGKVVGAIGVSGNTPQEDEDIVLAGVASFEASDKATPAVTYLPAEQVSQAFVKGMAL